jgi:hypothetical protein
MASVPEREQGGGWQEKAARNLRLASGAQLGARRLAGKIGINGRPLIAKAMR